MNIDGPKPGIHKDSSVSKLSTDPQPHSNLEKIPNPHIITHSDPQKKINKQGNFLKTIASPILFSIGILGKGFSGIKKFILKKMQFNAKSQRTNEAITLTAFIKKLFSEREMKKNLPLDNENDFDEALPPKKKTQNSKIL